MLKLKESFYNFKVEVDDNLVLYNTKTGAISIVEYKEKDTVLKILDNPNDYNDDNKLKKELFKLGFLVDQDKNELDDIKEWHEKYIYLENLLQLTILPAETCNFACPYCFNYKDRNIIMEDWVFDAIYKYIKKYVKKNKKYPETIVRISWFGGEPLLAKDKIIHFMNKVKKLQEKYKNLIIQSDLVTNGYLLDVNTFEDMVNNKINHFQVTLDGDAENHDKLRILKNGQPTFNKIYNNLLEISKKVNANFTFWIRGNFLEDNIDSMNRLIKKFSLDFKDDPRFYIYFRPVQDFETNSNIKSIKSSICNDSYLDLQSRLAWEVEKNVNSFSEIRIFDLLPKPTYAWCNVRRKNQYIIGADGLIYFCDVEICNEDKSVGRITPEGDILIKEEFETIWKKSAFDMKLNGCYKCKMFPICLGGCKRVILVDKKKSCFWNQQYIKEQMKNYARAYA